MAVTEAELADGLWAMLSISKFPRELVASESGQQAPVVTRGQSGWGESVGLGFRRFRGKHPTFKAMFGETTCLNIGGKPPFDRRQPPTTGWKGWNHGV